MKVRCEEREGVFLASSAGGWGGGLVGSGDLLRHATAMASAANDCNS